MFDLKSEIEKESLNYFNAQVRARELEQEVELLLWLWDNDKRVHNFLSRELVDEMEVARSLLEKRYGRGNSTLPMGETVHKSAGG